MSQLVHVLQTRQSQNLFVRTFWQTLNREWNGIDRLRLDKFYMLCRFVLRECVELLKKGDWEESLVEEFLSVLVEEVLMAEAPLGVQHHLLDIYLDEVAKVGSSELSADMNLKLIDPFCKVAAITKNSLLQQSVVSSIFQAILDQSPFAIEDLMKEVGHTPADSDNGILRRDHSDDISPVLQFDYQALADRLFDIASQKKIPNRNRKALYCLVKKFRDLAEGVFYQEDSRENVSTDEDDDENNNRRLRKRQKRQRVAREKMATSSQDEPSGRKGRQKRAAEPPENPPEASAAKRKRKKKKGAATAEAQIEVNCGNHGPPNTTKPGPPNTREPDTSQNMAARLKRRRRGCLLRLGLSVLPLRGALVMRRRRAIRERRKMITSNNKVTSENPAPAHKNPAPAHKNSAPTSKGSASSCQDFVTFQKSDVPKPLYVKGSKRRGQPIGSHINGKSKKVTFSLNKNMTAEFRMTDRSLLVSPTGSSRVPFNPNQQPQHGVLKTPTSPKIRGTRARAADFF